MRGESLTQPNHCLVRLYGCDSQHVTEQACVVFHLYSTPRYVSTSKVMPPLAEGIRGLQGLGLGL